MKLKRILGGATLAIGALSFITSLASCDYSSESIIENDDSDSYEIIPEDTESTTSEDTEGTTSEDTNDTTSSDSTDNTDDSSSSSHKKHNRSNSNSGNASYVEDTTTEETSDTYSLEGVSEEEISAVNTAISELELDYTSLYGYNELLEDSSYGSFFKEVYEQFYNSASAFLTSTEDYAVTKSQSYSYVIVDTFECSYSELDLVASAWITMIEENPLYYFTYTGYTVKTNGSGANQTYSFCFIAGSDYADASARYESNQKVLEFVSEFEAEYEAEGVTSDYDKAKFVHDYICSKVSYAYDESGDASEELWAHNILGVAYEYGAVCESYAETYDFLTNLIGTDAITVVGYSGSYGHAWNYVCVDNVWYGMDITWDDDSEISYDYFLVSEKIMSAGHTPNSNSEYGIDYQVALPTLSSSSYDTSLDTESDTGSTSGSDVILPAYPSHPTQPHRR